MSTMKTVILAGGLGTRIEEETGRLPKPMVEIGGRPILWHIMKHFAHHDFREFYIALGYKGDVVKNYFLNYHALSGDFTIDLAYGRMTPCGPSTEDWRVHLVDTGESTNTGGRVLRLREKLGREPFLLTYGDGVSDVDLRSVVEFHRRHGKIATITAVRPPARFGAIHLDKAEHVLSFDEKPATGDGWVNGGYMVLEPKFFDYLVDDTTGLEVLADVARDGELVAYRHYGYWQCMDTIRDKKLLEAEWSSGVPRWRVWK
jgi:glucose-1-phosphate cytidylyltransferase